MAIPIPTGWLPLHRSRIERGTSKVSPVDSTMTSTPSGNAVKNTSPNCGAVILQRNGRLHSGGVIAMSAGSSSSVGAIKSLKESHVPTGYAPG